MKVGASTTHTTLPIRHCEPQSGVAIHQHEVFRNNKLFNYKNKLNTFRHCELTKSAWQSIKNIKSLNYIYNRKFTFFVIASRKAAWQSINTQCSVFKALNFKVRQSDFKNIKQLRITTFYNSHGLPRQSLRSFLAMTQRVISQIKSYFYVQYFFYFAKT
ncbi:MAG: hypothetical protein LBT96_05190 [Campylobacteraceae bacterium]|jgi:hypothetical protein|nr:hypothetical protein [Campylobacteraceae bacterium]